MVEKLGLEEYNSSMTDEEEIDGEADAQEFEEAFEEALRLSLNYSMKPRTSHISNYYYPYND